MIILIMFVGLLLALTVYISYKLRLGVSSAISIIVGVTTVVGYNIWAGWL